MSILYYHFCNVPIILKVGKVHIMTTPISVKNKIELQCIRDDASFLLKLILTLNEHSLHGIFAPNIFPYFSLFILESYKYLKINFPEYAYTLSSQCESIIKTSRLRIKFFEDKSKNVQGVFELLDWVTEFHKIWHFERHKGVLSSLKKALQNDFGIYLYLGNVIGTTHTGLMNFGISKNDLPNTSEEIAKAISPFMVPISKEMGEYIGSVIILLEEQNLQNEKTQFIYQINETELKYVDTKSAKFLDSIFNGQGNQAINLTLLMFLTQVNSLLFVMNQLTAHSTYTLFKLKFITLYHVFLSLKRLQNYSYLKNLLTTHSKDHLRKILGDRILKKLVSQKKFRNTLVHYSIEDIPVNALIYSRDMFGLCEYYFEERSFAEISVLVDKQIERVSQLLTAWLNWQPYPRQIRDW